MAPVAPQTRAPSTGVRVLIVGAGFAGLTAAIECRRQGHDVTVVDKFPELRTLGDIISLAPNSARIISRWPGVPKKLEPISLRPLHGGLTIKAGLTGDTLLHQIWSPEEEAWGARYDGHRGEYHEVMFRHARDELGIDFKLDARAVDYFESDAGAGIELAGGARLEADVVLAAEGVRSRGRQTVLGYEDRPKPSGYAVYRAWFSVDRAQLEADPDLAWLVADGDHHVAWIGPDVHFIVATLKGGRDISWVCTHKDDADIGESWQWEAPLADARAVLKGWEPTIQKLLALTPEPLVDWKLVYRDPLETWVSAGRRIALIGDAAHPFLPTSIQGASQAMEDGATVAVCLRRAAEAAGGGSAGVPDAVAAFEALRYERVKSAQKTGEQTRDIWHKADIPAAKRDPKSMRLRREAWLLNFDAEAYADQWYDRTVETIRTKGLAEARRMHVPESRFGFLDTNGLGQDAKEPSL